MKKARAWLAEHGVAHDFHDYKKAGIDRERLETWEAKVGWETLLNRKGMMWRKVPEEARASIDRDSALQLMLDTPSIIKRPILVLDDGEIVVGFNASLFETVFKT
ncbi:MAG: Spx/MgsR family RNA polymerase-binding regulatory protein [Chromatiales bacterium]|nr:Spx/MgsR family RNA polymerase-binding regulatory protein [Gammaproteobacteria bacterium]MCP5352258.1 Spx/MgsR family RNA polymerase-binding regulatory protein [Chromatiales bacterium]